MTPELPTKSLTFGERLVEARLHRGYLTQQQFAYVLCVDITSVGRWERGDKPPPLANLAIILRSLGVFRNWLVSGDGDQYDPKFTKLKDDELRAINQAAKAKLKKASADSKRDNKRYEEFVKAAVQEPAKVAQEPAEDEQERKRKPDGDATGFEQFRELMAEALESAARVFRGYRTPPPKKS